MSKDYTKYLIKMLLLITLLCRVIECNLKESFVLQTIYPIFHKSFVHDGNPDIVTNSFVLKKSLFTIKNTHLEIHDINLFNFHGKGLLKLFRN